MEWKQYIDNLKKKYVGKRVEYEGENYVIVDVDYNGCFMINKKSEYNETTAIAYVVKLLKFID